MSQLENLLRECTIKLTIPGRMGWGTGFFVAPELILTCAHVMQGANGQQIQVLWQNQENWAQAVVEQSLPNPYDLALLRVTLPSGANPPCVCLDEAIQSRDPLYLFGYPDEGDPHGEPRTFNCDGITGSEIASILFNLGQVRPGMSGSPLLNQRTGKVCGIVKFTRDRSIDLGGGAIPTHVIFEQFPELRDLQQAFHGSDRRWSNSATRQSEINFQPYLKAIASTYEKWWKFYTLTDVERRQEQAEDESPIFDFGLMVQTVKEEELEQQQQQKQLEIERFPVLEGIRKYAEQHVLLVGRPGSGKSTGLARLLLEEATTNPTRIPVLVELRYWQGSLSDLIHNSITRHDPVLKSLPLHTLLANALLLFDGVNELPSEEARSQLASFRSHTPQIPMIFTTRDLGLGGDLGIEKRLEMQPLTEVQMKGFIHAYVPEQADLMLRQLSDRLREFGQTPLLLWMLCEVFQQSPGHQMPSNLAEVFRKFAAMYEASSVRKHEVALLKGDVRPLSDRRLWKPALQALAFAMMQGETLVDFRVAIHRDEAEKELSRVFPDEKFPVRDVLDDLLKYHLLQNCSNEQIEFRHQLIQEYYAAEYLLLRLLNLSDEQLKRDYLNYLKWTEPIALMLSLVRHQVSALRVVKLALDVDLLLGARLAGDIPQQWQKCAVEMLESLDVTHWLRIELLGSTRSKYAIGSLKLFMANTNSEIRAKAVSAIGRIVNDAAVRELCNVTDDESEVVRGTVATSLGEIGTKLAGLRLKQWKEQVPQESPYVDIRRQTALWNIFGDEEKPSLFRQIVIDNFDFEQLGDSSYTTSNLDFHTLERAADNESLEVRRFIVGELGDYRGSIHEDSLVKLLIKLTSDPDYFVRKTAFKYLKSYLDSSYKSQVIDVFLEVLRRGKYPDLRTQALESLQDYADAISEEEVIEILLETANESDFTLRLTSIKMIEVRAKSDFLPVLHQALDDDPEIRQCAAKALGKIGHKDSAPILTQAMANHYGDDVFIEKAIEALGKIGGSLAIETLGKIVLGESRDRFVQKALEALGNTKSPLAVAFLLKAEFNFQQSTSSWLELKKIQALGETAAGDLLPILIKSLRIACEYDCFEAVSAAIAAIQNRCKYYNHEIFHDLIPEGKVIALYFSYAPNDEDLRNEL